MAKLLVSDRETNTQREMPLDRTRFTIGKLPNNDLVLDKMSISRQHCEIIIANGGYFIRVDGNSRHMTLTPPGGKLQLWTYKGR